MLQVAMYQEGARIRRWIQAIRTLLMAEQLGQSKYTQNETFGCKIQVVCHVVPLECCENNNNFTQNA